jgi:hypothetical protein
MVLLAKPSSYGRLPLWLHHEIAGKKTPQGLHFALRKSFPHISFK